MKAISNVSMILIKIFVVNLMTLSVFTACGKPANSDVPVSIHAVNYSDQEFEYFLQDPARESNSGGGESITRFAAGGIMCCYSLPKTWHPGLKVKIHYEVYFPSKKGEEIRILTESSLIDIPQYKEPHELWVVRDVQGEISIVLSNFQPDHPNWPGKVKGWPVPSLAYRRERWNLYMDHELAGLRSFEKNQKALNENPEKEAREAWPYRIQYYPDVKEKFSGPNDPKFLIYLKEDYKISVERSKELVRQLEVSKP